MWNLHDRWYLRIDVLLLVGLGLCLLSSLTIVNEGTERTDNMATEMINVRAGTREVVKALSKKLGMSMIDVAQAAITDFAKKDFKAIEVKGKMLIVKGTILVIGGGLRTNADGTPYKPYLGREDADDLAEMPEDLAKCKCRSYYDTAGHHNEDCPLYKADNKS